VLQVGKTAIKGGGWHHYLGMSIDGFDDTAIWMINGYAKGGGWAYAIGKVLGKTFADLEPKAFLPQALPGGGGKYSIKVVVANLGDRAATPTRARVALARSRAGGASILLGSLRIPKIAPGGHATVASTINVPKRARVAAYPYLRLTLDSTRKLKEYGERNNTAAAKLKR
jgi:hypothetical protein